jgi:predicted O-linked N-acetylglucosamine transferase (SPINDLY family)
MGVPVVTLPGPTFAGRLSARHLTDVGLAAWIVADRDAYVRTGLP